MFEVYRETADGAEQRVGEDDAEPGTALVVADGAEPPAARWRWRLTLGDKVIARSEESWAKRGGAVAAIAKVRTLVAGARVVETLA